MNMDLYFLLSCATIFILLVLSAVFSSSETAMIASSKAKLHNQAKQGDERARSVALLRRTMGRLITTLLVGGTLINVAASALAAGVFVRLFGEAGVFYATLVMGFFIVLYGEVLPKILALNYPERIAVFFVRFLLFIFSLLSPVATIMDLLARKTLGLFGVKTGTKSESSTNPEELRGLIDLHMGTGEWVSEERAMLRGIMDLTSVDIAEIMTHRKNVKAVNLSAPLHKTVQEVIESPYTRIPLWLNDPENIVGVLHVRALFKAIRAAGDDLKKINLLEIATKPWFIPESTTLLDQLQNFRKRREHFAIVVDEYGEYQGIVTLEDILEEIVGEIEDEHDVDLPGVRAEKGGSYIIVGQVTLRDLNRRFEWGLPDEEASTLAGLLLHETRQIPDVGQVHEWGGFKFEVLRKQRHQITLIRVMPPAKAEADPY